MLGSYCACTFVRLSDCWSGWKPHSAKQSCAPQVTPQVRAITDACSPQCSVSTQVIFTSANCACGASEQIWKTLDSSVNVTEHPGREAQLSKVSNLKNYKPFAMQTWLLAFPPMSSSKQSSLEPCAVATSVFYIQKTSVKHKDSRINSASLL